MSWNLPTSPNHIRKYLKKNKYRIPKYIRCNDLACWGRTSIRWLRPTPSSLSRLADLGWGVLRGQDFRCDLVILGVPQLILRNTLYYWNTSSSMLCSPLWNATLRWKKAAQESIGITHLVEEVSWVFPNEHQKSSIYFSTFSCFLVGEMPSHPSERCTFENPQNL